MRLSLNQCLGIILLAVCCGIGTSLAALAQSASAASQSKGQSSRSSDITAIDYTTSRSFPNPLSAYSTPYVPETRMTNSDRLRELISDGHLRLSAEDAVALALENNLDIAVARYNLPIAQTDVLRATSGGAARGVAGAYQSSTIFSGVLGGGVGSTSGGGGGGAGGVLGGGTFMIPATGCCDPTVSYNFGWDTAVTPLNYTILSGIPVETTHSASSFLGYSQGFLTGTSIMAGVQSFRLSSDATTPLFNPSFSSGLLVGVNQHLLNGFGYRANAKFIRIARNDLKYSESVFRQAVSSTVAQVLTLYYALLYDREAVRVAQQGLDDSQKLLHDNQLEAGIGAMARLDVAQAELAVAQRKQELVTAQNSFEQDQQSLKASITKSFDGQLAQVEIDPTGQLPEPQANDVPSFDQALTLALRNRPEVEQANLNLRNQAVTIQAVHNALLPTLDAYAGYAPAGLSGSMGPALGDLFRGHYPDYAYGVSLNLPLRNRTEQADAARALLEQRQLQTKMQQARNQVVWDVSKAVSAVRQERGQLDAARNVVTLARQTLAMEQTKFQLGRATVLEVIQAQRDLAAAEGNEVKARSDYAKALIQFQQATGTLLQRHHIELADAKRGKITRPPQIPGTPSLTRTP